MDHEQEYFYGAILDKPGASVIWNNEEDEEQNGPRKLFIKQILLGHTAKEGEYNVVEVETLSTSSDMLKIPLAVLRVGETRSVMTSHEFSCSPVTFKLIEGNGPVYIHGNQVPLYTQTVEDEMMEEEQQEEEQEEEVKPSSKKRKLGAETAAKATNGNGNNHKTNKKPIK